MRNRPHLALVAFVVAIIACKGPVGPQGPGGETGASGPGTRLVFTGTLDTLGSTTVDLPAAAGTITSPPLVTCYVSPDGVEWYVVGGGPGFQVLTCVLRAGAASNVQVLMTAFTPANYAGKGYKIVVVY